MRISVSKEKFLLLVSNFWGFMVVVAVFAVGVILQQADVQTTQLLARINNVALIIGFIGQFILSWRRSKGIQIYVLINLALILILPNKEAIARLIALQLSIFSFALYMYPTILLFRRNHKRKYLYAFINLIFGVYVFPWALLLRQGLKLPRLSKRKFH